MPNSLKSVAWTIFQLYDPAGDLNAGKWRLPMYRCPTKLGIDIQRVSQEPHHSEMMLALRLGDQNDQKSKQFNSEAAVISHYQIAHFHKEYVKPLSRQSGRPASNTLAKAGAASLFADPKKSLPPPQMQAQEPE